MEKGNIWATTCNNLGIIAAYAKPASAAFSYTSSSFKRRPGWRKLIVKKAMTTITPSNISVSNKSKHTEHVWWINALTEGPLRPQNCASPPIRQLDCPVNSTSWRCIQSTRYSLILEGALPNKKTDGANPKAEYHPVDFCSPDTSSRFSRTERTVLVEAPEKLGRNVRVNENRN